MEERCEVAVRIVPYGPEAVRPVMDLQLRYAQACPGAAVIPQHLYAQPAYAGGANILCAYMGRQGLVGYAPVYPAPQAPGDDDLTLWTVLKVDPNIEGRSEIQDALHARLVERVAEILGASGSARCSLKAQCQATETDAIGFWRARGWQLVEGVYHMSRDLAEPLPGRGCLEGVEIIQWEMRSERERHQYLDALNRSMPGSPGDEGTLQSFLQTAVWPSGTTIAAFAGEQLVGNVMLYQDLAETERMGHRVGVTEDVWVLPGWRGRGIATCMLSEALAYLSGRGYREARLQVSAPNVRALRTYERLGYRTISESQIYEQRLCSAL